MSTSNIKSQSPNADTTNRSPDHSQQTNAVPLEIESNLDIGFGDDGSTKVSVGTDPLEKQIIEALCYEFLDTSQSAGLKHAAFQAYFENAGNIHPGAILSDELEEISADAILAGEIAADDLPDEYTLEGETDAFDLDDQDNRGRANSYTPTFTPDDLANEGRSLTWSELKDAVDRHWGPDLEIHPDRVKAERLKRNRKFNAKVIAGVLRSQVDVVPHALIDDRIEEYLGHQIERADYDDGLRYKISKHKDLVIDHLEAHPNVTIESYYASQDALETELPSYFDQVLEDLEESYAPTPEAWRKRNLVMEGSLTNEFEPMDDWLTALAEFRKNLAKLPAFIGHGKYMPVLEDHIEYDEEQFEDVGRYIHHVFERMKGIYASAPEHARYVVWNEYIDYDGAAELSFDQTTQSVLDFKPYENDDGRMPLEDRFKVVAKNLDG
ncbi:hypothetical protein [Natronorubrum sp. DTA7]|uniref:hypothetical protein n=1 Tax=Natronorubrum sp. DTA7 TaxID=3447016 RepID=UPI003F8456CF